MEYLSNERFTVRAIEPGEVLPPLVGYVEVISVSDGMVRAVIPEEDFAQQYTEVSEN